MPSHYYLGRAKNGQAVKRKSNRDDFTHAAIPSDPAKRTRLPSFATSVSGAMRNFASSYLGDCEVVEVALVDAKTFNAAGPGVGQG